MDRQNGWLKFNSVYLKSFVLLLRGPGIEGIYKWVRQGESIYLSQCLSVGVVLPPSGHWTSEDTFDCHRDVGSTGRGHKCCQTS